MAANPARESPPSYNDAAEDTADGLMEPAILVLSNQSIHAESATSAPLYQFNRGIATLGHATSQVEFERVESAVKTASSGEPSVKQRPRHIYNLEHPRTPLFSRLPSDFPPYFIRAVSRRTLGHVGLKKHHFRASRWKALPVDVSSCRQGGDPRFAKDAQPLFLIQRRKNRYEWTDNDGNAVAVEDEADGQHRLVITASLHRQTLDALVALWCCRVWQYSADHRDKIHEGIDGGETKPFAPTDISPKTYRLTHGVIARRKFRLASEAQLRGGLF